MPRRAWSAATIAVTGKLTAASATQIEGIRRAIARQTHGARLDLVSVIGFDDVGARLLANALAEAAGRGWDCSCRPGPSSAPRSPPRLKNGRAAGEGAWLLSLELLQWTNDRAAFEDRAIEFAVAFELSPPSWEPPPAVAAPAKTAARPRRGRARDALEPEMLKWSGVMAGIAGAAARPARRFACTPTRWSPST